MHVRGQCFRLRTFRIKRAFVRLLRLLSSGPLDVVVKRKVVVLSSSSYEVVFIGNVCISEEANKYLTQIAHLNPLD